MEKLFCFLALLSLVQLGLCNDPYPVRIDKRATTACVANGTKCNASSQVCCNDPTFVCGRGKRTGDDFLCLARADLACVGPDSKCNATMQCCESSTYKCQEKGGKSLCKQCAKDGKLCENGEPCCTSTSLCTKIANGTSFCLPPGQTPKMYTTTTTTPPTTTPACTADNLQCDITKKCCSTGVPCTPFYLDATLDVPKYWFCATGQDVVNVEDYKNCENHRICKNPTSTCTRNSPNTLICIPLGGTISTSTTTTTTVATTTPTTTPACTPMMMPCTPSDHCCQLAGGNYGCVNSPLGPSVCLYCAKDGQKCKTVDPTQITLPVDPIQVMTTILAPVGDPLVCCDPGSVCGETLMGEGPQCIPKTGDLSCIREGFMCSAQTSTFCCGINVECLPVALLPVISICQYVPPPTTLAPARVCPKQGESCATARCCESPSFCHLSSSGAICTALSDIPPPPVGVTCQESMMNCDEHSCCESGTMCFLGSGGAPSCESLGNVRSTQENLDAFCATSGSGEHCGTDPCCADMACVRTSDDENNQNCVALGSGATGCSVNYYDKCDPQSPKPCCETELECRNSMTGYRCVDRIVASTTVTTPAIQFLPPGTYCKGNQLCEPATFCHLGPTGSYCTQQIGIPYPNSVNCAKNGEYCNEYLKCCESGTMCFWGMEAAPTCRRVAEMQAAYDKVIHGTSRCSTMGESCAASWCCSDLTCVTAGSTSTCLTRETDTGVFQCATHYYDLCEPDMLPCCGASNMDCREAYRDGYKCFFKEGFQASSTAVTTSPISTKQGKPCNENILCESPTLCHLTSSGAFCTDPKDVPPPPAGATCEKLGYGCTELTCCESPSICVLDESEQPTCSTVESIQQAQESFPCSNKGDELGCDMARCCGDLMCIRAPSAEGYDVLKCVSQDDEATGCVPYYYMKCDPVSKPCCSNEYGHYECRMSVTGVNRCFQTSTPQEEVTPGPTAATVATPAPQPAPVTDMANCHLHMAGCSVSEECCGHTGGAGDHACVNAPIIGNTCLYCATDGQTCRTAGLMQIQDEIKKTTGDPLVCCNSGSVCGKDNANSGPKCMPKGDLNCIDKGFMCGDSTSTKCCESECKPAYTGATVSLCQ